MIKANKGTELKNILFVHYGEEWIRGSERCLLDLLQHLDKTQYRPIVWCNAAVMQAHVNDLDITVIKNDFSVIFGWQAPYFDVFHYATLINIGLKLVEKYNIDLLHANSGAPNQWLLPVARSKKIPLLCQLHSPYLFRDRLSLGLHQSSLLVGVSHAVTKTFYDDGVDQAKVEVIHNGIDTDYLNASTVFPLREELGIPNDDFLLATVGSLIHRKGVDLLLTAVKQLHDLSIPITLLIIGDGDEKKALQLQTKTLGLCQHVFFMGECNNVQQSLRSGVDLFVSAAREEAFGLVLAEAAQAKLAVIAPRVGGIPEVVVDQRSRPLQSELLQSELLPTERLPTERLPTGLLIEKENISQLVDAIHYLYSHPKQCKEMGINGYNRVQKIFSITTNVSQFQALYKQLINKEKNVYGWRHHWLLMPIFKRFFTHSYHSLRNSKFYNLLLGYKSVVKKAVDRVIVNNGVRHDQ